MLQVCCPQAPGAAPCMGSCRHARGKLSASCSQACGLNGSTQAFACKRHASVMCSWPHSCSIKRSCKSDGQTGRQPHLDRTRFQKKAVLIRCSLESSGAVLVLQSLAFGASLPGYVFANSWTHPDVLLATGVCMNRLPVASDQYQAIFKIFWTGGPCCMSGTPYMRNPTASSAATAEC